MKITEFKQEHRVCIGQLALESLRKVPTNLNLAILGRAVNRGIPVTLKDI